MRVVCLSSWMRQGKSTGSGMSGSPSDGNLQPRLWRSQAVDGVIGSSKGAFTGRSQARTVTSPANCLLETWRSAHLWAESGTRSHASWATALASRECLLKAYATTSKGKHRGIRVKSVLAQWVAVLRSAHERECEAAVSCGPKSIYSGVVTTKVGSRPWFKLVGAGPARENGTSTRRSGKTPAPVATLRHVEQSTCYDKKKGTCSRQPGRAWREARTYSAAQASSPSHTGSSLIRAGADAFVNSMEHVDRLSRASQDAFDRVSEYCKDKPATSAAIAVAALTVSCAAWNLLPSRNSSSQRYKQKPGTFELSGGNIDSRQIKTEFEGYSKSYGSEAGAGITDRSNTSELVDKFYSLVTDIYEWGWGQSFHFSPLLPGKSVRESEAAHEARLAAIIGLRPGKNCLDVGCGVGGPMRTIAATSGGIVTGITINDYQVSRAEMHNKNVGIYVLASPLQACVLE